MEETIVISLGGSLIVPEELDVEFLKNFKQTIVSEVNKGKKFLIITGGGKICRKYQDGAKVLANPSNDDLDWIGIASLKLNAELVRVMFEDLTHYQVIPDLSLDFPFEKPIVVGSAYKPGHSTDFDAVLGAKKIGAKKIVNLSNIDHVYDSDPRINKDAKKFENISWDEYRALIPSEWNPGLSSPFDPIASKMAHEEGMTVYILNGKPIENFEKCIKGEEFKGTKIF